MTLAHASIGQLLTVTHVGGERAFRRRLMELGLVPGTRVEFAGIAPLGDPLKLVVRGCALSIRKSEAASVEVTLVGQAAAASGSERVERASVRPAPQSVALEPASASAVRVAP